MDFMEYIRPELLVLVPVMYLIGAAIKRSAIKDKYIPLILGGIAISLCIIWVVANSPINTMPEILTAIFTAVTQGALVAGASVYANQIYKQSQKEE